MKKKNCWKKTVYSNAFQALHAVEKATADKESRIFRPATNWYVVETKY